jgi:ABC-type transporter Mla subunit MlaD
MTRYLEILGRSVTVPDPDCVASLATGYGAVGSSIGHAKDQLTGLGSVESWAQWTGVSADEFAGKLGGLPGQLGQALDSYNTAAWALSEYASGLGPVVAALVALSYQAEEAEGTLRATQAARDQAIQQGQDPAVTGWDARLWEAETTVSELGGSLSSLLDQLESLSSQCTARIRQAEQEGIQNNLVSDFERYVRDVGEGYLHFTKLEL